MSRLIVSGRKAWQIDDGISAGGKTVPREVSGFFAFYPFIF